MINAPTSMIAGAAPPPSGGLLKTGRTMPSTLPDHAPTRTVGPRDLPSAAVVHDVLAQEGVDATSLDDLLHYAGKRGWSWRITGGRDFPHCRAAILAPWVSREPWAQAWGEGPTEAMSMALALTVRTPPPVVDA